MSENLENKTHPGYNIWKHVIPFPSIELMQTTGSSTAENFLVVGEAWSQVICKYIKPSCSILDIGCGCGKTARMLATNPFIESYVGFDVIRASIEWNKKYISPQAKGFFQFLHYDLYSAEYNPSGKLQSRNFSFPVESETIDISFAASLFTHLLIDDAKHYLSEICRTLKEHGRAILSIHNEPNGGEEYSGNESRIDMSNDFFERIASDNGLIVDELVGELCGQETFVFRKR